MTESPVLDDMERTVARTLAAKAGQLVVDDVPFVPVHLAPAPAPVPARAPRRRALAAAAAAVVAVALAAAALGVAIRAGGGGPTVDLAPAARYGSRPGTAAYAPATLPPGWALRQMDVGAITSPGHGARWQLFAGLGSPAGRGVLVGSVGDENRAIRDTGDTVLGRPAEVRPSPDPDTPAGTVEASWIDGGVAHDALAVGMDGDELVAFLDTLVARPDPATGFTPSAATPLPEAAQAGVADSITTRLVYGDPAGGGVQITATSSDRYGGLLHRLAGDRGPDGYVLRGPGLVSLARTDGWTVDVRADGSATARRDPAVLDDLLARARPVTVAQLVEQGVAEPVTGRFAVDAGTLEVHGTPAEAVALCLVAAAGPPQCTTAEDGGLGRLTAGSFLVDGRWKVVTITPHDPAEVHTTAFPPPVHADPVDLTPGADLRRSGGALVQVVTVPDGVGAVEASVPIGGGQAMGYAYERPQL